MNYRWLLVAILLVVFTPAVLSAREYQCPDQPLLVVDTNDADRVKPVCESANEAIEFLANYKLRPQRTIKINIVDQAILSEGYDDFGSYDIRSEVVTLMSYQSIFDQLAVPEMYGEPFDSFIIRELLPTKWLTRSCCITC